MGDSSEALPDPIADKSDDDDYVPPEAKTVEELMAEKDGEDEAMQRYKASLLKSAASAKTDDPRRVVITEMQVLFTDRDPIVFDLSNPEVLKNVTFVLKEGCQYKTQLTFRVQNEIVSGLKYKHVVKRMGVAVDKTEEMLGSYGPSLEEVNTVVFPRRAWEEAPKGMMARAKYTVKTSFVDDDKQEHLSFGYSFEIKKDWA
uniref:Rho GDP-dissociation inhibitor n=1 Tax=Chrysotila carterae TaxID=13221 RepID=A0A7S4C317_CHRCT|mmetsp:Transcript_957/g.1924  ORF Transcript_957/g.1924 Transcript_957/m.1924 type:complete len:201 (-) Transcript_957:662-1264(-)